MKIVFFGTPDYVVPILDTLHKSFKIRGVSPISAVVTQEPKLVGREQIKTFSPVDKWAYEHKKPIYFEPMEIVSNNIPADIGVLASYGKIIPETVIKHFRYGIVNIHPSLLPLWRGSSPIQASILSGEKITGVTFMKLDALLDHGPIISQFKDEILETDDALTLRTRLFERASEATPALVTAYINGKTKIKEQEHEKAMFTRQLKKEDGFIPPEILSATLQGKSQKGGWEIPWIRDYSIHYSPITIHNYIRAMNPWPSVWTSVQLNSKSETRNPKRIKILKAHVETKIAKRDTQNVTRKTQNIKCKSYRELRISYLVLDEVQLEGKSPVSWKQFCEGYPEAKFQKTYEV